MKKRIVQNGDWVAPKPGCAGYLTPGMNYQVRRIQSKGHVFNIVDNDSEEIICALTHCGHSPNGWYIHSASEDEVEDNVEDLIEIL